MDSLRSPLTPDVRPACAAPSWALTASRLHHTSSRAGRHRCADSTPTPHDVVRSHHARTSVIRLRGVRVLIEHNGAHPVPLTARPPWLAVPTRRRLQAIRSSSSSRRSTSLSVSALAHSAPLVLAVTSRSVNRYASTFDTRSRNAERLAMPCFTAPPASESAPPDQRTCKAARCLFREHRRPRSSSTRPVFIGSGLTPACSGLAALATDARR